MLPAIALPACSRFDGAVLESFDGHPFPSVAVLYAREDSIYKRLAGYVYDIRRDARHYNGPFPVVAHPPCRAWGRLLDLADRCAVVFRSGSYVTPGLSLMGETF